MSSESQIARSAQAPPQFALRLALFYGTVFGLIGTQLPFFPVWLAAIGLDAGWIGVVAAVPSLTRFTVLPLITSAAERRGSLRGALIVVTLATTLGFAALAPMREPLAVLMLFVLTACAWTPAVPLTDGYALKGVLRYGLDYGPLRLWGSAAFIVGALACGLLVDVIAAEQLIWVIVAVAALGAATSFVLRPLDAEPRPATAEHGRPMRAAALLRRPAFVALIAAVALIQGSHVAYYVFASILWKSQGLGGLTTAVLWALGVIAEIVLFALSPRLALSPLALILIGALAGVVRWSVTALGPPLPVLVMVQLLHGLTYGATLLGAMALLARHVPGHVMASAQGYLAAATGLVSSMATILSGQVYAQAGERVYLIMAAMALAGGAIILAARRPLAARPDERCDPK